MCDRNFLVLGTGMMGRAVAYDLVKTRSKECVVLADARPDALSSVDQWLGGGVELHTLDVSDGDKVKHLLADVDVLIVALPYGFNLPLMKLAIESGCHFCDLGGNDSIVAEQISLDSAAKEAGVLCLPDCGLAPGMANVLASHLVAQFDTVERLTLRVGGLPQHPVPPLNYQLGFSIGGLINEYVEDCKVLRDGGIDRLEPMTELEELRFEGLGRMEAFLTSGGSGWLPEMYEGYINTLDYKTIRYPGHCERFKLMLDLGLASREEFAPGITPRMVLERQLEKALNGDDQDLVLVKVLAEGVKDGERCEKGLELVDRYDETTRITAMMRTTAFPTSIIAQMMADSTIKEHGVMTPEMCVPGEEFLRALNKRDINFIHI